MPRRTQTDHDRFDHLYTANLPLILGFAARRCEQVGDAADIAAEVFLVAWRRLDEIPVDHERVWLFGVAKNALANQRRGRLRRHRLADRLRDELLVNPPAVARPDEVTGPVLAALRRLPERDRELLQLVAWDGLTPSEIASLENVPAATVRSRLMRARLRLRELLGEPVPDPQRERPTGHVTDGRATHPSTRS